MNENQGQVAGRNHGMEIAFRAISMQLSSHNHSVIPNYCATLLLEGCHRNDLTYATTLVDSVA